MIWEEIAYGGVLNLEQHGIVHSRERRWERLSFTTILFILFNFHIYMICSLDGQ